MSSVKQVLKQIEQLGKKELSRLIGKEDEASVKAAKEQFYKFVYAFQDKSPNEFDHWHTAWGRFENTVRSNSPVASKTMRNQPAKETHGKNIKI